MIDFQMLDISFLQIWPSIDVTNIKSNFLKIEKNLGTFLESTMSPLQNGENFFPETKCRIYF